MKSLRRFFARLLNLTRASRRSDLRLLQEMEEHLAQQTADNIRAGAPVGLVGAFIVSHLMAGLLYGVSPSDPLTLIGITAVLVVVALAACYIPVRRAIRVDPIVALREAQTSCRTRAALATWRPD